MSPTQNSDMNASSEIAKPMGKIRLMKNLLVLCLGFLLLFCAFQALANLQSTINSEEGLGVASQSVIYGVLILSSLFLPKIAIRKLGCKWAVVLSILMYSPYIAANFYPHYGTLIPTAAILSLGAAPLWASKCVYVNEIGCQYAARIGESEDVVISRFFGIFFMIFQNTQIWGNLISYYVLKPENNTDYEVLKNKIGRCGIDFCPSDNETNPNLLPPTQEKRFLLTGIYLVCSVLAAVMVAAFLDPLKRKNEKSELAETVLSRLFATLKHLKNPNQLLLVPLTIFSGIEQAYILGDFTRAYIACAWGVYHVGYVFICFGVVNALMSFMVGRLVKYIPRSVIIGTGFVGNLAACIGMFLWSPNPEESYVFFIFAGVWGYSDAIWQTQINAYYAALFKGEEEAAFSNYRLWESVGFFIAFAYSKYFCTSVKIYILLAFLIVGNLGYGTIELATFFRKKKYNVRGKT